MKKFLIFSSILLIPLISSAQQAYLGVQNSNRKGMINARMNPAEINNLTKRIEVNFFSVNASLSNDVFSFQDFTSGEDFFETAFERVDQPVNLRSEMNIMGPSFGMKLDEWSIGLTSQAFVKADVVNLNPVLGDAIANDGFSQIYNEVRLDIPYNQRVNTFSWAEIGLMAGRNIWETAAHSLSAGATLKLLFPGSYMNLGLSDTRATLIQDMTEISLTDASGELNLTYENNILDDDFTFNFSRFHMAGPRGVGLDLGLNYQFRNGSENVLNTGLALRNIGGMGLGSGQLNHTYVMNIPEGERFRVDMLEGNLEEIEQQLLESGYFTLRRQTSGGRITHPLSLSAYAEWNVARQFQVSVYGQKRLGDENANDRLTAPDLLVITPRLIVGKLEIYSPWIQHQIAGFNGGLGVQFGGFFVGSQSLVTGLAADTKQVDFHMGLSWGF
ncbi:DUF5723 family protein [Negadavirga shengliensis]|uniref:DUF5723 family protein n=1 Tax=Negadavirga shengliensis TaxID=1389218 RepID=A0ABV9SWV0_9BACT